MIRMTGGKSKANTEAMSPELLSFAQNTIREQIRMLNERFDRCFTCVNRERGIAEFLYDYLGVQCRPVFKQGTPLRVYDNTARDILKKMRSSFIENVCPRDSKTFALFATEGCIDKIAGEYYTVSKTEVRAHINDFMLALAELCQDEINSSNFHDQVAYALDCFFITDFNLLIQPNLHRYQYPSSIAYEAVLPFSIAKEFNAKQELIAYFRSVKIKQKLIRETYPDFNLDLLKDKKPDDDIDLREYCVLEETPGAGYKWFWFLTIDTDKLACIRVLDAPMLITFADTIPIGGSIGHGVFYNLYSDILATEDLSKNRDEILRKFNEPLIEEQEGSFVRKTGEEGKLQPGDIVTVREKNTFTPVYLAQKPEALDVVAEKRREAIRSGFVPVSEQYVHNPNDTATNATLSMSRQVAFLASVYGKVIDGFVVSHVHKILILLTQNGSIPRLVNRFFKENRDRLPMEFLKYANEPEVFEKLLKAFAVAIVNLVLDINNLNIKTTSKIGMATRAEKVNEMVQIIQLMASVTGQPVNMIISPERFITKVSEIMGLDHSVLLTEKERRAVMEQMQAQMQAQMQLQATQ